VNFLEYYNKLKTSRNQWNQLPTLRLKIRRSRVMTSIKREITAKPSASTKKL
jgi:hypothetical protein